MIALAGSLFGKVGWKLLAVLAVVGAVIGVFLMGRRAGRLAQTVRIKEAESHAVRERIRIDRQMRRAGRDELADWLRHPDNRIQP